METLTRDAAAPLPGSLRGCFRAAAATPPPIIACAQHAAQSPPGGGGRRSRRGDLRRQETDAEGRNGTRSPSRKIHYTKYVISRLSRHRTGTLLMEGTDSEQMSDEYPELAAKNCS